MDKDYTSNKDKVVFFIIIFSAMALFFFFGMKLMDYAENCSAALSYVIAALLLLVFFIGGTYLVRGLYTYINNESRKRNNTNFYPSRKSVESSKSITPNEYVNLIDRLSKETGYDSQTISIAFNTGIYKEIIRLGKEDELKTALNNNAVLVPYFQKVIPDFDNVVKEIENRIKKNCS